MRIANISDRLCIIATDGAIDVYDASGGRFATDAALVYDRWSELRE